MFSKNNKTKKKQKVLKKMLNCSQQTDFQLLYTNKEDLHLIKEEKLFNLEVNLQKD